MCRISVNVPLTDTMKGVLECLFFTVVKIPRIIYLHLCSITLKMRLLTDCIYIYIQY